jgi:hypothetical protein
VNRHAVTSEAQVLVGAAQQSIDEKQAPESAWGTRLGKRDSSYWRRTDLPHTPKQHVLYPLVHSNCYGSSPTHKLLFMSAIILPESGMNSAFCSVASALWLNRGEDIIGERYPMTWAEQWINEHYSTRAWARMRLEAASYGTT